MHSIDFAAMARLLTSAIPTGAAMLCLALSTNSGLADENGNHHAVVRPNITFGDNQECGIALPRYDASLSAGTSQTVQTIHVQVGDWVTKGSALVTFDNRIEEAAVQVARQSAASTAALREAELAMQAALDRATRTEIALRAKAASEYELQLRNNEYDQSAAAHEVQLELLDRAKAELALATAKLEAKTVRAPFDGQVVAIQAQAGNAVPAHSTIVRVCDARELLVHLDLPSDLYENIARGQSWELTGQAPINRSLDAEVEFISPLLNPKAQTFRAVFSVGNPQGDLPAFFSCGLSNSASPTKFISQSHP